MNGCRFARVLVPALIASSLIAQCPPQGLTMTLAGGRLGDPAFLQVNGAPFALGMIGLDVASGPTPTSFGTACLGLTPQLQLLPFTFGPNGVFAIGATVPPSPWLDGLTIFAQALAQPGGPNPTLPLAWSNGARITLSSPKLVIIDPGFMGLPQAPAVPGSYCVYDALADAPVTPVLPLPSSVKHAISVPSLRLVALLLHSNAILVIDANNGSLVSTITPPTGPAGPNDPSKLASDGVNLYVVHAGYEALFFPAVPGVVRSYSLPSGAPGPVIQLPFGNPNDILLVPGSNVAYLRHHSADVLNGVPAHAIALPVDLAAGVALPHVDLGTGFTLREMTHLNGVVYCVVWSAYTGFGGPLPTSFLTAFDPATSAPLFPSPVPVPALSNVGGMRGGPGTGGLPALFLKSAAPYSLFEVSPATLGVVNTMALGGLVFDQELSSGGAEWLLVVTTGAQSNLVTLSGPTLAPNALFSLPASPALVSSEMITPLPSATLRKAFLHQGTPSVFPFGTDPSAPLSTVVTVPVPARIVLAN